MSDTTSGDGGGFLGMSPDFARNLLNFGASTMMAANARTPQGFLSYGAGALGPVGAGLVGMQQQGMDIARLRGELGLQQAQTQHTNAETDLARAQIPMMQGKMGMLQDLMSGGGGFGGGMPGGMGGQPFGGGFTGNQTKAPPNVIPPQQHEQMVRDAVKGTDVPAELLDATVDHESGWDANASGTKGEIGLGQIMPSTATNPGFGVPSIDPHALATPQNNLKFAAQYLHGIGQQYGMQPQDWSNPTKVAQVLHDYNGPQSPPAYANSILSRLNQPPTWAPKPYQIAQAGGGALPMPGQGTGAPLQLNMPGQMPTPGGQVPLSFNGMSPQQMWEQAANLSRKGAAADALLGAGAGRAWEDQAQMLRGLISKQQEAQMGIAAAGPTEEAKQRAEAKYAGPKAGAEAAARAPYQYETARPGSVVTQGGKPVFSVPIQSPEVVTSGPNTGVHTNVFRDPLTGQVVGGQAGSSENNDLPPGAVPTALSPQQEGMLKAQPEVIKQNIEHDRTTVEGDLSHVVDNVIPAKQQLFQLRGLVDQAAPGAAGQLRADFKNWVQTFAPDFVSQIAGNASPAQEFNKIALMGAGKQERGDLGARGGFRAIELYMKANPSLEMQPQADKEMANALLVSHQFHEDYATGASNWYTQNLNGFMAPNAPRPYKPISQYDQQFIKTMRPELYASAISAMNGKPYAEWSKGLTGKQMQIVGGILQRTDPSAMIDVGQGRVPVTKFKTTMGPNDIMGGG